MWRSPSSRRYVPASPLISYAVQYLALCDARLAKCSCDSALHREDAVLYTDADPTNPPYLSRNTVGWVCILPIELAAAQEMLDKEHQGLPQDANDSNIYTLGRMGGHNTVIA
jgi:hypothetical protein